MMSVRRPTRSGEAFSEQDLSFGGEHAPGFGKADGPVIPVVNGAERPHGELLARTYVILNSDI